MAKKINIEKLNKKLKQAGQKLRIESAGAVLRLSNGRELTAGNRRLFLRRLGVSKHSFWAERIDRIYDGTPEESRAAVQEVKSTMSARGGKEVWAKHRDSLIKQWTGRTPANKGKKMPKEELEKRQKYWQSAEHREKCSKAKLGEKNPFFGKTHSEKTRAEHSQRMKKKILSGEFTPNSNNRNTHWDAEYRGQKYRSSWEALYHSWDSDALYEQLRIPYKYDGKESVYIVDFVNHDKQRLVEVKPKELTKDPRMQAKITAARKWAEDRGYTFVLADQEYLTNLPFPELEQFDPKTQEKIRKLYEAGQKKQN